MQPKSERRCNCQQKSCRYCRDRNKYEEKYDKIMARVKAASQLKRSERERIKAMPPDDLIRKVEEDDDI